MTIFCGNSRVYCINNMIQCSGPQLWIVLFRPLHLYKPCREFQKCPRFCASIIHACFVIIMFLVWVDSLTRREWGNNDPEGRSCTCHTSPANLIIIYSAFPTKFSSWTQRSGNGYILYHFVPYVISTGANTFIEHGYMYSSFPLSSP